MESDWVKVLVAVLGVLFAIGGAVSALLQAKWVRAQRKTLRKILGMLRAIQEKDRP